MKRATAWLPTSLLAALIAVLYLLPTHTRAADIGYVEDFALAKDRATALKHLIPGTEDYYYYHALHALNTGQYDAALSNFKPWIERHGHTARVTEIQVRHALLTYEKNPQASIDFLKSHLGLLFNHQREVVGAIPQLPTMLDQNLIGRARLKGMSISRWGNLDNFEDGALDFGTGYDCMDELSATASPGVSPQAHANRIMLRDLMVAAGFRPYRREWWHFELIDEPFPNQSFDFPIRPRPKA